MKDNMDADRQEQMREINNEVEAEVHKEYIERDREIYYERSAGYWE